MKKKNIIKKLLSVILSAATVFSLLALPAHAIVPGEDAYAGQEDGYVIVDCATQEKQYIDKSEVPTFTGTGTYDVLNEQDRTRLSAVNMEMETMYSQQGAIAPSSVTSENHYFVPLNQYMYSGVVILGVFENGQCTGWGTGFMIDEDNLVTSLHLFYELIGTTLGQREFITLSYIPEVRVFFNVNTAFYESIAESEKAQLGYDKLEEITDYIPISSIMYSSAVDANLFDDDQHDWAVARLETATTEDVYYWNCAVYNATTIGNATTYMVGYPTHYILRMVETTGGIDHDNPNISDIENDALFLLTNSNEGGMSGGPIYVATGGIKCYGIIEGLLGGTTSIGVQITSDLLSAMVDYMNR